MHEWIKYAKCKGKYDLFFPARYERASGRTVRIADAKSVCDGCPVREPCAGLGRLLESSPDPELHPDGVWGGKTRDELLE